jgi:hypothetical protein
VDAPGALAGTTPVNGPPELCQRDPQGVGDPRDRRPRRICLAALDARHRGDGQSSVVGQCFLRAPVAIAQRAQCSGEILVGGVPW